MPRTAFGLITQIAFALFGTAILLGRSAPRPDPVLVHDRTSAPPRYSTINRFYHPDQKSRLLDVVTGEMLPPLSEPGALLNFPTCSPWQDAQGRWQVVTTWRTMRTTDSGDQPLSGLARFSFPDTRLLDRVGLPVVPSGPACWLPGTAARLVFAGGDGVLYRFDFEEADGTPARNPDAAPCHLRSLRWLCPRPGDGWHFFDPSCPVSMPGGPWIFVTTYKGIEEPKESRPDGFCWLRLSPDGDSVVEAGLLTLAGGDRIELRIPIVVASASGKFSLAYLSRPVGNWDWSVGVAPLTVDPSTGTPWVSWEDAHTLTVGAAINPPAFSSDGRFLFALVSRDGGRRGIIRLTNPLTAFRAMVRR